jgi:outer membrane cobalamin receptor
MPPMRLPSRSWYVRLILALSLGTVAAEALAAAAVFEGRQVSEVLRELQGGAVKFIFSSTLLPNTLVVGKEPRSADPLAKAREILEPYGLALRTVAPGHYAVVRDTSAKSRGQDMTAADARSAAQKADAVPLAEVVVSTSRYATGTQATSGSFHLQGADLAAQPSLGDDSLRALARLPGIAQSGVSAQSNVRGGEAGEVLVLLDGFPLRQAFHLPAYQGLFSILDPGAIGSAEVFTGGFPARYGNRMSGVFDLSTLSPSASPLSAVGLSFFNATGLQTGHIPVLQGDYLVAGRVGTLRPLVRIFSPGTGSPSYSDVLGRFGMGEPDGIRLTGNVLWARDGLAISSRSRGERANIESLSRYLWLRADREWSDELSASVWAGHSRIDSVRRGELDNPGIALGSLADSRMSRFWDVRGQVHWQAFPAHYFELGFEGTSERATYRYVAEAQYSEAIAELFDRENAFSRVIDVSPSRERGALFGAHRWRINDALTSEVGLRLQRVLTEGASGDWMEDPRVSLRWQLNPSTNLRVNWGRFHQADEVQELAVDDGLTAFPLAQRSDHLIFGLDHRFGDTLSVRVEAFRKDQSAPRRRFENFLSTLSILPELAPDRIAIAPDFAEVSGVEVLVRQERPEWTRWGSLTWSDAKDEIGGSDVPRSWDQTWALMAGFELRGATWRMAATASAHRGWPTTRLIEDSDGEMSLGTRNDARLPYYASLDIRAERWRPAWGGTFAYALEISNAIDRHNPCCVEFSSSTDDSGAVEITGRQRSWLPLIPSISVRWER